MLLKETVTRQGVQPQIFYAIGVAECVYREAGFACIVTSLTDSHEDRPASLHNKGLAVDFRTRHLTPEAKFKIAGSLKAILDPQGYDVVMEANHIHVEFDPKGKEHWIHMEAVG